MTNVDQIIMRTEQIGMHYPGTIALENVDYRVYKGKVNVIIGENGAGKSTLMKILAGVEQATHGKIILRDQEIIIKDTRDAVTKGIGMVHQELNLFENLNVAENIFLGHEIHNRFAYIDHPQQCKVAAKLMARLAQDISPETKVASLKVGQQQLVEIAKSLAQEVDILILDEPTSALSQPEVDILFKVIRELTAQGVSIIYISHRLEELMTIGDYITILRDGRFQAEAKINEIDLSWIIQKMLGSDPITNFLGEHRSFGKPVLSVKNLSLINDNNVTVLDKVSFEIKQGEIIGIYGLMGAGRTELFECLLGVNSDYFGEIIMNNQQLSSKISITERIKNGMSLVTEDRKRSGIFPKLSVAHNLTLASLWRFLKINLLIDSKKESTRVDEIIKDISIKVSTPNIEISSLSGGNQQKVMIGRSLINQPNLLLLDEPSRGIDVGAKAEVFETMARLSEQGIAILFSSSDLKEVMAVSDRIMVMSAGKVTANVDRCDASEQNLVNASAAGLASSSGTFS